jgi:SAM-dependent methyltransferase
MSHFQLDEPSSEHLRLPQRFHGWYIPGHSQPVRLKVQINGRDYSTLSHGSFRHDVQAAFPEEPIALESGFWGDLLLPAGFSSPLEFSIVDDAPGLPEPRRLCKRKVTVEQAQLPSRHRSFDLAEVLRCPNCGARVSLDPAGNTAGCREHPFLLLAGVPHFHCAGELPFIRLAEQLHTHPYGDHSQAIFNRVGPGDLILDFGAGNTPVNCLRPNVVYLDVQHYRNTDVVCTTPRLPFADNTFEAVISQAVFEHLADPHETARELRRVLKPGGTIYIDTAFLQPLHGDPSHFFNMTLHGLRKVTAGFDEVESGVASYQYPTLGMKMQIEAVLPFVQTGVWKERLQQVLELLQHDGKDLDEALGDRGRQILAAGVFFEGRKPVTAGPPAVEQP